MISLPIRTLAATVIMAAAAPQVAAADSFPSKPMRMICPYAPGGSSDILARSTARELTKMLGQQVVVENRPGAGQLIGGEAAARANADGYTILLAGSSLHAIMPVLYTKLNFDPNKELMPIIALASFPNILVVYPNLKARTVKELIALAKTEPGKLTFASSGNGTTTHMSAELFKYMTGVDMRHIPYKGSGPAFTDIIAGQVDMIFDNIPGSLPLVRSGKLRAIAVTGAKRAPQVPDLPTIAETLPGYEAGGWYGLEVPLGTPKSIIAKLNAAGAQGIQSPEFKQRMTDLGFEFVGGTPEDMAGMIKRDIKRWHPVVKASGAKAD
jgi:tripartite-type tricarboxylate transporter receptor subunit TctC